MKNKLLILFLFIGFNGFGCTSSDTIKLTLCIGDSTLFNGVQVKTAGFYKDTFTNAALCDSFVTLDLKYYPAIPPTNLVDTICRRDSVFFKNKWNIYNTSGNYTLRDTQKGVNTCDSIIILNLRVNNTTNNPIFPTLALYGCKNKPFLKGDSSFTTDGFKAVVLKGANSRGCDSTVFFNLTRRDTHFTIISAIRCADNPFFFNGSMRTNTGIYMDTLVNRFGCDSFIQLDLEINPLKYTSIDTSLCNNHSYFFKGQNRTIPNIYKDTLKTTKNCDSFATLTLLATRYTSGYRFYTKFCSNSTIYFNGKNIDSPGIYYDTLINSAKCDSFLTMVLQKDTVHNITINKMLCQKDSIYFDNKYISIAGIYNMALKNQGGCDSLITLNLSIFPNIGLAIIRSATTNIISADSTFSGYKWFYNSYPQANVSKYFMYSTNYGEYYVIAKDLNNCYIKSNVITYLNSNINGSDKSSAIVYPIPAKDYLIIESDIFMEKDIVIRVFSIDGKVLNVLKPINKSVKQTIDVSELISGLYILKIESKNQIIEKKILIESK